jgi:hypothetical protein
VVEAQKAAKAIATDHLSGAVHVGVPRAAANHDFPDFSVCKCNTREIAKDSTSAMVA